MLKYTLGALAAAAIIIGAAFVILAQVTGGGADAGPARTVILSAGDGVHWPLDFQVEAGEIIELQLNNQSTVPRSISLLHKDVEQLPEAPGHDEAPIPPGTIRIEAEAGLGDSAYVRFKEPGEYTLDILYTGTYFPPSEVKVFVR